jgi:TPR repeat protein
LNAAVALVLVLALSTAALSQIAQTQDTKPDIPKLQAMAEGGDASAQLSLGLAYQNGRGVQQDDSIAVEWYRKAAAAGNSEAQSDLGVMYMNGWGVEKDKAEALRWYHLAAKQKNAHAMFNLGAAYYNGDGVGIDDARAYAWFLLAQDAGSQTANDAVQRSERELGPTILSLGMNYVVEMYFKGDELNRDYKEGVRWLRKSAAGGDVHAQLTLAGVLTDGVDSPPDYEEGRHWCEAALQQKSAMAAYCLGTIYRKGLGVPKDATKALSLLREAADSEIAPAMEASGEMLASGEAGKVDRQQALIYLIGAILNGDQGALSTAAEVRAQMSDKEWKRTQEEIKRRFRFFRRCQVGGSFAECPAQFVTEVIALNFGNTTQFCLLR